MAEAAAPAHDLILVEVDDKCQFVAETSVTLNIDSRMRTNTIKVLQSMEAIMDHTISGDEKLGS